MLHFIHALSIRGRICASIQFERGRNFMGEKMCISLFWDKISALHALVQGEYAFVQGELLWFAWVVCWACDYMIGVEPFASSWGIMWVLPSRLCRAVALVLGDRDFRSVVIFELACSLALDHLGELLFFLLFIFPLNSELVTGCCQCTHQRGDWGPCVSEDRWMVAL